MSVCLSVCLCYTYVGMLNKVKDTLQKLNLMAAEDLNEYAALQKAVEEVS